MASQSRNHGFLLRSSLGRYFRLTEPGPFSLEESSAIRFLARWREEPHRDSRRARHLTETAKGPDSPDIAQSPIAEKAVVLVLRLPVAMVAATVLAFPEPGHEAIIAESYLASIGSINRASILVGFIIH